MNENQGVIEKQNRAKEHIEFIKENTPIVPKKDKVTKGTYVHTFKKPFEYEGKKYETLNFYFDQLTGRDMIAIEDEMSAVNKYPLAPEISSEYLIKMASKASNTGSDVLESLPLSDFKQIRDMAREHLVSVGL